MTAKKCKVCRHGDHGDEICQAAPWDQKDEQYRTGCGCTGPNRVAWGVKPERSREEELERALRLLVEDNEKRGLVGSRLSNARRVLENKPGVL